MNILKNRTVIGILCIVLSLIICFCVTPLFNKSISQKTEIVRVAKEIKSGDKITADMLKNVEVGGYNLPKNVIRNKETIVGKYADADFSIGDYILSTKVTQTPTEDNNYLCHLNGERQAISVTLPSFASGLSGKLQRGDIVKVIAPDYKKQGVTVIPPELQFVEVIAVTANSGFDANQNDTKNNSHSLEEEKELPTTVTLLVSTQQSKILAELEADGKLHLSLVYRGSNENATAFLDEQEKLLKDLSSNNEKME